MTITACSAIPSGGVICIGLEHASEFTKTRAFPASPEGNLKDFVSTASFPCSRR